MATNEPHAAFWRWIRQKNRTTWRPTIGAIQRDSVRIRWIRRTLRLAATRRLEGNVVRHASTALRLRHNPEAAYHSLKPATLAGKSSPAINVNAPRARSFACHAC